MHRTSFYHCPHCDRFLVGQGQKEISCWGQALKPLQAQEDRGPYRLLDVSEYDGDLFVKVTSPMTKEDDLAFVALVTPASLTPKPLYPEWDKSLRLPMTRRGHLYTLHKDRGLFVQDLKRLMKKDA